MAGNRGKVKKLCICTFLRADLRVIERDECSKPSYCYFPTCIYFLYKWGARRQKRFDIREDARYEHQGLIITMGLSLESVVVLFVKLGNAYMRVYDRSRVVSLEKHSVHSRVLRGLARRDRRLSEGKSAERFSSCSRLVYSFEARFNPVSEESDMSFSGSERPLKASDKVVKLEDLTREAI